MCVKNVWKKVLLLSFFSSCCTFCYAEQVVLQDYIQLVGSGKYQLESTLSHNDIINTKQENFRRILVLAKDSDKSFFSCYRENIGFKKQEYYLIKHYNDKNKERYFHKYSKKPIEDIHGDWSQRALERWLGNGTTQESIKNELQNTHDEIYSMLGPITEANHMLRRYKVLYKRSGQWQRNGKLYDFDEYELIEPMPGTLIMCYTDGKLAMCMKSQSRQIITNDGFGKYQLDEKKAVILELRQFDDNVDDSLFFKQ